MEGGSGRKTAAKQRPGRPAGGSQVYDSDSIVSAAFDLTKKVPLVKLSIVMVANELGVTPALIHYYINGGKTKLISSVVDLFYKKILEKWPEQTDDWKKDIISISELVFSSYMKNPGVASYILSQNRFELFKMLYESNDYHAADYFEKMIMSIRRGYDNPLRTTTLSYLLQDFIAGSAYFSIRHNWPEDYKFYLEDVLSKHDLDKYPGLHYISETLITMNAEETFKTGLEFLTRAMELDG